MMNPVDIKNERTLATSFSPSCFLVNTNLLRLFANICFVLVDVYLLILKLSSKLMKSAARYSAQLKGTRRV